MLQDYLAKRPSEIDAINGMVPVVAREVGTAAPYNEVVTAIVKAKERAIGLEPRPVNAGALSNSEDRRAVPRTHARVGRSARDAARSIFPSGIVHDSRRVLPYPIYVERAAGSHKWDADGNEYVDYHGGHGSLILGHCDRQVTRAAQRQLELGTHPAACHDLEVRWGTLVKELVPCAERVRFNSSGTEANLMALRLARAVHGEEEAGALQGPLPRMAGPRGVRRGRPLRRQRDPGAARGDREPRAARVLRRPRGNARPARYPGTTSRRSCWSRPAAASASCRSGTSSSTCCARSPPERGVILIFDEVVTGFRVARGGAQAHYGIIPDLATFAKILGGAAFPAGR